MKRILLQYIQFYVIEIIDECFRAGMVCAFVSNELVRQQLSKDASDHGMMKQLIRDVDNIEMYQDATLNVSNMPIKIYC